MIRPLSFSFASLLDPAPVAGGGAGAPAEPTRMGTPGADQSIPTGGTVGGNIANAIKQGMAMVQAVGAAAAPAPAGIAGMDGTTPVALAPTPAAVPATVQPPLGAPNLTPAGAPAVPAQPAAVPPGTGQGSPSSGQPPAGSGVAGSEPPAAPAGVSTAPPATPPAPEPFVGLTDDELLAAASTPIGTPPASGEAPAPVPGADPATAAATAGASAPGAAPTIQPATFTGLSPDENTQLNNLVQRVVTAGSPTDTGILETMLLRSSRGQRMLESFKTIQALEAPPNPDGSGGLGYAPAPDEIRQWQADHDYTERLVDRFNTGTAESTQEFWQMILGRDPESTLSRNPGARAVFENLPQLAERSPALRQAIAAPIEHQLISTMHDFVQRLPGGAIGTPENEAKEAMIWAINALNSRVFGRQEIAREAFYAAGPMLPKMGTNRSVGAGAASNAPAAPNGVPNGAATEDPNSEVARLRARVEAADRVAFNNAVARIAVPFETAQANLTATVVSKALGALRAVRDPGDFALIQDKFLAELQPSVESLPAYQALDRDIAKALQQNARSGKLPVTVEQSLLKRYGRIVQSVIARKADGFVKQHFRPFNGQQAQPVGSPASVNGGNAAAAPMPAAMGLPSQGAGRPGVGVAPTGQPGQQQQTAPPPNPSGANRPGTTASRITDRIKAATSGQFAQG